jgi:hypothetical protein
MPSTPLRSLGGLLLLALSLTSCSWMAVTTTEQQTKETVVQIKSLSQIFQDADVAACTRITAAFPPYVQFVTVWAGRATWEECLRVLHPY